MKAVRLDEAALLASEPQVFGGPIVGQTERFQVQFLLNDPRGTLALESFAPNSTVNWAFWHDEVHYITRGSAIITYTLAPNHRKQVTRTFTAGDAYLIPTGGEGPGDLFTMVGCQGVRDNGTSSRDVVHLVVPEGPVDRAVRGERLQRQRTPGVVEQELHLEALGLPDDRPAEHLRFRGEQRRLVQSHCLHRTLRSSFHRL